MRDLYEERGWNPRAEKKWTHMNGAEQIAFAVRAQQMLGVHKDVSVHAIVVNKCRVQQHIRTDPNKLYNWMIQLSLLKKIATFDEVTLVPDPRSIKVASGNSLSDYLQMKLWFEMGVRTSLVTKPRDSKASLQIQFADMLSGLVQMRFEDRAYSPFQRLAWQVKLSTLFCN